MMDGSEIDSSFQLILRKPKVNHGLKFLDFRNTAGITVGSGITLTSPWAGVARRAIGSRLIDPVGLTFLVSYPLGLDVNFPRELDHLL